MIIEISVTGLLSLICIVLASILTTYLIFRDRKEKYMADIKAVAKLGKNAKYLAEFNDEDFEYLMENTAVITEAIERLSYTAKYYLGLSGTDLDNYVDSKAVNAIYKAMGIAKGVSPLV